MVLGGFGLTWLASVAVADLRREMSPVAVKDSLA
jgi:hypothetical protein